MVIVYLLKLNDFGKKHADSRKSLSTWKDLVLKAHGEPDRIVLRDFQS